MPRSNFDSVIPESLSLFDLIARFIDQQIRLHPQLAHGPLAKWYPTHETQILIDSSGLVPDCDNRNLWFDDDGNEHRNIRIPYRASTDPSFTDRFVDCCIAARWKYIGTTGWNWKGRTSRWVGFDFDSIANHTEGLQQEEIDEVLSRARQLPYVQARTSKSGKGIHLIAHLKQPVPTPTSREHRQLAAHVLRQMSRECRFDFKSSADVCGSVLWHWSHDLTEHGLQVL
jgi:hypothetical protein